MLEEAGKLDSTQPMSAYLPDVPADKAGVTLHHLLTHSGGLVDYLAGDYDPLSRDEALRIALEAPLRFEPGARYEYSNAGYTLLAAIIELVSGEEYESFLRENLFEPAGMESTGYRLPDWDGRVVARFHADDVDNGTNLEKPFPSWALMGNGEMLTTTLDMFLWHQALMGDELFSVEAKRRLYRPFLNDYAYGWRVTEGDRGRVAEHGGASSWGSCAYYRRYLDADVMFILFCNQVHDGVFLPGAIREQVAALAFGEPVEFPPAVPEVATTEMERLAGNRQLRDGGEVNLTPRATFVRLAPLDQRALDAILPTGDIDAAELGRQALGIVKAASRGDFEPLTAARPAGRPLAGTQRVAQEFCRGAPEATFVLVGTVPSTHVPNALDTLVTTAAGEATLLIVWRDGKIFGCGMLDGDGRGGLSVRCVPVSGTELLGYHAGSGRAIRVVLADASG